MKLAACFLTLLPGFAVAASWTSPGFPAFSEQGTGTFVSHAQLPKGTRPLMLNFDQQCWQPADAIKLNQMLSLQPCSNTPPQWRLFRDGEYTLQLDTRSGTPTLMISIQNAVEPVASLVRECPKWDGLPLTLDVSATFAEGAAVRDYYSQQIAIVKNGQITLQPAATSNGLLLLERAETDTSAPFDWHNATVYFVLTDRFENGDPNNDQSYGRHKDGMAEIGTFHGGDLRGLTNKLDYLQQLGVNALWISAPFEQIHGWVGGGTKGDFPHYAYHCYYTQDWTNLDANMGSEADLRTLVDSAHQRGIRILFDVVMNHTGYATLADMQEYQFGALYLSGDELKKTLNELVSQLDSDAPHMLYWQSTRAVAHRMHAFPKGGKASLMAFSEPCGLDRQDHPYKLISVEDTRFLHCNIKTLNLIPNCMAMQQAVEAGCDEVVFHRGDRVTEGAHSGLAILKDGVFCTPPADNLILPSITRKHFLTLCDKLGVPTRIAPFTVDELKNADELMILSTGTHCVGACELDGKPLGGKDPALLDKLQKAYQQWFDEKTAK